MRRRLASAVVLGLLLASGSARGQATPPAPEHAGPPVGPHPADTAEEKAEPVVDFDGSEKHDWWVVSPSFALRLIDETGRDELLMNWPTNLVEGTRTTAAVFELSHRAGRLTFVAGAGLAVATTRSGGPAELTFVDWTPQLTGVAAIGVDLHLPKRWKLHIGATTTGTTATVGATAKKEF